MKSRKAASDRALLERIYQLCSSRQTQANSLIGNGIGTFFELAEHIGYKRLVGLLKFGYPHWHDDGEFECTSVKFWLVDSHSHKVASVEGILAAAERLTATRQKWRWGRPPGCRMQAKRRKGSSSAMSAWVKCKAVTTGEPGVRSGYRARLRMSVMRSDYGKKHNNWKRYRREQWKQQACAGYADVIGTY